MVADYPVGRGEFIGRKHVRQAAALVEREHAYVLREIPDKVIPPRAAAPRNRRSRSGWLMDFTGNKSILVDFEGGKVRTRVGGKEVTEEVATEMLVLRGDGKLVVKQQR